MCSTQKENLQVTWALSELGFSKVFQCFINKRLRGHGGKSPVGILDSQYNIMLHYLCRCLFSINTQHKKMSGQPAPLTARISR